MSAMRRCRLAVLLAALPGMIAMAATDAENRAAWNAPQTPIRVYGNTWYVGPHGLSIFLIVSPRGDVLIDGGLPETASVVESNIRALGVDPRDIKLILNSHAHFDHAGGIAQLAHDTGARVIASAPDAALMARGGRDDPQYADKYLYAPVRVMRTVKDGEIVRLGHLALTAHLTPGHTKGNTTWTWIACENDRCLHLVDAASLSAPGYTLIGNAAYPSIVKDFERSFAMVAALPCDIVLSPHPGAVDFWERIARRDRGDADALIDRDGCRNYANKARAAFETQLTGERVLSKCKVTSCV